MRKVIKASRKQVRSTSNVSPSRERQYELLDIIYDYGVTGEDLADFLCGYFSADDIVSALEYYLRVYLEVDEDGEPL